MEPTLLPLQQQVIFQKFLRNKFNINIDNVLIDNSAIIAGGSVLNATITESEGDIDRLDQYTGDIDLYVHLKNAQNVYNNLLKHEDLIELSSHHTAPPYDQSFLIKNNILGRFTVRRQLPDVMGGGDPNPRKYIDIDIMIVSDDVSLESVVDNFDLSFCKIWYDGRNILTNYPDDVRTKTGSLGVDYLRAYLSGNIFTIKRIKKYTRRGFTIKLPNIDTSSIIMTKLKKQVISPEIWVVYRLLQELLYAISLNKDMEFSMMILALQKLSEYKTTRRKPSIYNIDVFKDLLTFLYTDKLRELLETPTDGFFWDVDKLIYLLICIFERALCDWIQPEYANYFKSIGIQIRREGDVPAHGFENYDVPMCDGQDPPFSAGASGIPDYANSDYLDNLITQGENILKLTDEEKQTLYYTVYPHLKPGSVEYIRRNQTLMARRFANLFIEEEEEEEEESYSLPNGTEVPGRCFSIIDGKDINTSSWYPEEGSVLFLIEFYPGAVPDLVCTNVEIIENALRDETRIHYRCGGNIGYIAETGERVFLDDPDLPEGVAIDATMTNIDYSVEYIPFSYGIDGTTAINAYLPRTQVEQILRNIRVLDTLKVFTLEFSDTITHTISKNNTDRGAEFTDYVSTNHCQSGTAIMVFKVKEFTEDSDTPPPPTPPSVPPPLDSVDDPDTSPPPTPPSVTPPLDSVDDPDTPTPPPVSRVPGIGPLAPSLGIEPIPIDSFSAISSDNSDDED
jgi:hypothetical protein